MVTGLDVAAGAAQLISLADLTLTKIIPAVRETTHVDSNVNGLHKELQHFRDVIESVESHFGLRSIHRRSTLPPGSLRSLHQHLENCRAAIEQLNSIIPQPREGESNYVARFFTMLKMRSDHVTITRMQEHIATMRSGLLLWINLAQAEEARHSNTAQDRRPSIVQSHYEDLHHNVENLKRSLHDVPHESSWQDAVLQDAEECLSAARSVGQIRSTRTASNSSQAVHTPHPTNGSTDGRSTDDSTLGSILANEDPISSPVENGTPQFYTSLIDSSKQEVHKHRTNKRFDEAAAAQYEVISYSRKRQQVCQMKFHDERSELKILADLYLLRKHYGDAAEILEHLRTSEAKNTPQAWELDFDLASAYFKARQYLRALEFAQSARKGRQSEFETGHPKIIKVIELLEQISLARGQEKEARSFAREALTQKLRRSGNFDRRLCDMIVDGDDPDDIQRRIDETQEDDTENVAALQAFHMAVAEDQRAIARALWDTYEIVRNNVDVPNEREEPPLLSATRLCYTDMVHWLLEQGSNPDVRTAHDLTPLMEATKQQSTEIVRHLLDNGAAPRLCDQYGRTALHHAVGDSFDLNNSTSQDIIHILLVHGSARLLQVHSSAGMTVLHEAAEKGNTSAITLFLKHRADIEARDVMRRTPLIVAIDGGQADSVEVLLKNGANVDAEDARRRTPEIAARQPVGNSDKIRKLLRDHRRNRGLTTQNVSRVRDTVRATSDASSIQSSDTYHSIRSGQDVSPLFSLNYSTVQASRTTARQQIEGDRASIRTTATIWGSITRRALNNVPRN